MNDISVSGKNWISKNYGEEKLVFLKDNLNLSEILSKLIAIRNIRLEEVKIFLEPKIKNLLPNPFILKDMDKAVERTIKAITKNEKIGIFGDYDVDGATSTAILGNYFDVEADEFPVELRITSRSNLISKDEGITGWLDAGVSIGYEF